MKKKKTFFLLSISIITISLLLYFIGMYFFGGKRLSIKLDSEIKNELISLYEVNGIDEKDIVTFEYITYMRNRTCVLKINKNDETKRFIDQNPHIDRCSKLKLIGFPYPNNKYIPYDTKECCCFYDNNYYYLSVYYGGTDYNKRIRDFFWEKYNSN